VNFIKGIKIHDTEYEKIRAGKAGDGGYVVLLELCKKSKALYSYGVSNDVSFELDFLNKSPNAKVRLFDHTIDKLPENHTNFSFTKEGVSHFKNEHLNTIESHLSLFGDTHLTNKTLKIDVEWAEWGVFENMSEQTLSGFDQILCEFHTVPVIYKDSHSPHFTEFHKFIYSEINGLLFERYSRILNRIFKNYYAYHVHLNNSLELTEVGGEMIPSLVELSLVNKNLVKQPKISNLKFPIEGLDFPNKPHRKDILGVEWNRL